LSAADFVPPATMDEAHRRRLDLIATAQEIQAQLGDRNRLVDGARMRDHEWWKWRFSAIAALRHKSDELRRINSWIKERHAQTTNSLLRAEEVEFTDSPESLIYAAWRALRDRAVLMPPTEREQRLIDALREYARNHGK
jgi:hypothetical protein